MKYIVLPILDAKQIFTEEELSTMRKSTDETEIIIHEEILISKREAMGMSILPSEETGQIEWTYPVYEHNTETFNNLLNSEEWASNENI